MSGARTVLLFALAVVVSSPVVVSLVAAPASAGAATGTIDSAETPDGTETASPAEPTPTPDDGPNGHADDPFPRWLPVAFAGVLVVGIAAVGGGLWFVHTRIRRFLGR